MSISRRTVCGFIAAIAWVVTVFSCTPGRGRDSEGGSQPDPIGVTILNPAPGSGITVYRSPLIVSGTATGPGGITSVTWQNAATTESGEAIGGETWTATVPLIPSDNPITITVRDARGGWAQAALGVHLGGSTWAWGWNQRGALGSGATIRSLTPIGVIDPGSASGLLEDVVEVSGGGEHSLALLADGTVRAWGSNIWGQLGDGTLENRPTPVTVLDPADPTGILQDVISVSAGGEHSVALLADGSVRTWGDNEYATLGDGVADLYKTGPTQVIDPDDPTGNLTEVISIAAGLFHTLAIKADRTVRGWGWNGWDALGDAPSDALVWAAVPILDPNDPSGLLTGVTAVGAGGKHSIALKTNGSVWTWGTGMDGQLGWNSYAWSRTPLQVVDPNDPTSFLTDIIAVGAGDEHSLALKGNGTVWAWGTNGSGQIGTGGYYEDVYLVPVQVVDPADPSGLLQDVVGISGEYRASMALHRNGSVTYWGSMAGLVPEVVEDPADPSGELRGVSAIDTGWAHRAALLTDGTLRTWGLNDHGRLGDGTSPRSMPMPVQTTDPFDPLGFLDGPVDFDSGSHNLAILPDGTVRAWGRNSWGAVGDDTQVPRPAPVRIVDPSDPTGLLQNVVDIEAGDDASAAVLVDGTVRVWGYAAFGTGTPDFWSGVPLPVLDPADPTGLLTGVATVTASTDHPFVGSGGHFIAIKTNGEVWGWGRNRAGQVGDGTTQERDLPVRVIDPSDPSGFLTDVIAVSAGTGHTLALKSNGTVWAWGANDSGQLGDGNPDTSRSVPEPVRDPSDPSGFLTGAVAISAGLAHSVTVLVDGTIRVWGRNLEGQLGDGSTQDRPLPVIVEDPASPGTPFGGVRAAAAGYRHTVLLRTIGTVWAMGENREGELGDGTFVQRELPVQVIDVGDPTGFLQGVSAISAGSYHTVAVK